MQGYSKIIQGYSVFPSGPQSYHSRLQNFIYVNHTLTT